MSAQLPIVWTSAERAKPAIEAQIKGAPAVRARILERMQAQQIRDVLKPHTSISFGENDKNELVLGDIDTPGGVLTLHRHALGQIAGRVKVPMAYVNLLQGHKAWGVDLLAKDLTTIYRLLNFKRQDGDDAKFLVRIVGKEVRGFLSRRYALHLSTNPLLAYFLDYCHEMSAEPVETLTSDVRTSVKCVLPTVFEPFPGQALCVGMTFHNSDFGAGVFSVSNAIWDPMRGLGMTIGTQKWEAQKGELFERVHLGPMLHEVDMNTVTSARADRMTQIGRQMRQEIGEELSAEKIQRVLSVVRYANERDLPWLLLRRSLTALLSKEELETISEMLKKKEPTLPNLTQVDEDGLPVPTSWWAANAVSMLAKSTTDVDRALDLQQVAGRLIEKE